MRLIAGILHCGGAAAIEAELRRMAAAMTPPGLRPAIAVRLDGPAGLIVIDFSSEPAPLADRDGWIIAADLRLDRPFGTPEAELLRAVECHGQDFPDRLDGDFGVALWNRQRQELWLGRDFIGVRPLSWTWQPERWFAFASLPKGLHGSGLASPTLDLVAQARKVTQTYFSGPDSGFEQIQYLQAGHSLCIRHGDDASPQPHRAYRPSASQVGRWQGTPEAAAATLQALVKEAVAVRIPQGRAVACHLTGGLDSSSITVLAARLVRQRGQRLITLNVGTKVAYGPAEFDERPFIAEVLQQEPDITHRFVADVLPLPGMESDPDWPGSIVGGADDQIMAEAAAFGADRLLSGVGGDEGATYNGANLYVAVLRSGRLWTVVRELMARAKVDSVPLLRTVYGRLARPILAAMLQQYRKNGMFDQRRGAVRYLAQAMVKRVIPGRLQPVLHSNRAADRVRAFSDHHIPSRCTYYSILAARHGVSVSFPMLDRRIVDFILSLPVHFFLSEGYGRQPFRRAMHGILPEPIRLANRKVGLFDHRFVLYAQHRDSLLGYVDQLRSQSLPALDDMFDLNEIRAGIETLPTTAEIGERTANGGRIIGDSPWITVFALEALFLARQIAYASGSTDNVTETAPQAVEHYGG